MDDDDEFFEDVGDDEEFFDEEVEEEVEVEDVVEYDYEIAEIPAHLEEGFIGDVVEKNLSQDQHITFINNGHVPINSCFFSIAKQFLNNPKQKLDESCAKTSTTLDWD